MCSNLSHISEEHFRVSALFSFLPAAEHHQPLPAPSSEKLKFSRICCLLPSLPPAVAGYKLRFFLWFPNFSPIFPPALPHTASSSLAC
ncbi:hypothetical protein SLEP1_g35924 [Rubroshorea leprosula]|uniref:Uncharacterized protein n=1 Tax=Rubroshorea leprosula TaxID=152421 RepID=A0AAV5KQD6_9ROSI|nr:hypothetical protein SLEP1_g35924 [Rubroshorea leprosula]